MSPTSPSRRPLDLVGVVKLISWVVVIGCVLAVFAAGLLALLAMF